MKKFIFIAVCLIFVIGTGVAFAADIVPDVIMMPGTQPNEATIEDPGRCLNCHKDYETNPRVEPGFGWMGAAMGNAGRDPIFWATLAIAEQDFDGAGDLCIRCHSSGGWIGGRSTPTDGSGLNASDENGIDCDTCHQMTDPDMQVVDPISGTEIIGTMTDPFINNAGDSLDPALAGEGYYGSGMYALSNDYGKLGPYNEGDAVARHQFMGSDFHRDVDFCGTCHDVSNSAVGQLAPNAGTLNLSTAPDVQRGGGLGYPLDPNVSPNDPAILDQMAAFNNPPYAYGIVERTFSEFKSTPFGTDDLIARILVDEFYTKLPTDLQDPRGSLYNAYMASTSDGTRSANYEDGDPRYFSCQTCHMRAITGRGCDKSNAPNRLDQPMHDQTGGNYWVFPLVQYQDIKGTLRLGGGLSTEQIEAMDDGTLRAKSHLTQAGTLDVNGDIAKITNMTGHKLISGYPEGRRMWVNIRWFDNQDVEMTSEEVGAWGELPVDPITNPVDPNQTFVPKSIVNLEDPRLKVYEVHPAMTRGWAQTLMAVAPAHYGPIALGYDRLTGDPVGTIADLANGTIPGHADADYYKTFHFVLNNYVADDNRIPPYQMDYDEAKKRNALPVPDTQYGDPGPGGVYQYWDEFDVKTIAPQGARRAELTLYYQGTSWEYVQFLNNAVSSAVTPFLADEGKNFLDAWVNAQDINGETMVPPYAMATATWVGDCIPVTEICNDTIDNDCDGLVDCNDPDCTGDPVHCPELIEWPDCFDGIDNDSDGLTDCEDTTDCQDETEASTCGLGVCSSSGTKTCLSNGTLEDTCTPLPATEPGTELTCDNGADDDCDGLTDTQDPDCPTGCADITARNECRNTPGCEWVGGKNGMCQDAATGQCTDNDQDGYGNPGDASCPNGSATDCDDNDPAVNPGAIEGPPGNATCSDGKDNDCDGLSDMNDPGCMQVPDCTQYTTQTECDMYPDTCRWKKKQMECINR